MIAIGNDWNKRWYIYWLFVHETIENANSRIWNVHKYVKSKECVLRWWKQNGTTYPILSKMAKDIFGITATSIPTENYFPRHH